LSGRTSRASLHTFAQLAISTILHGNLSHFTAQYGPFYSAISVILRINTTGSVVLFKPQKGKQALHTLLTPITIALYNNKNRGEKSRANCHGKGKNEPK